MKICMLLTSALGLAVWEHWCEGESEEGNENITEREKKKRQRNVQQTWPMMEAEHWPAMT